MRMCLALALSAVIVVPALAQPPRGGGRGMQGGTLFLLTNKSVQEELKITEAQVTKIKDFGEKVRADNPIPRFDPNGDRDEQMKKIQEAMKAIAEKADKFAKETLTEDQTKRLKQIGLQQGGVLAAATNEETAKALKITDAQKGKLKDIGEQVRKDLDELRQGGGFGNPDTQKKMAGVRKEASEKAIGELTDEQKKTWTEMTGKPFEIKIEAGAFGKGKNKNKDKDKEKDK